MKRSGRNRPQTHVGIPCPVVSGVQSPDFLCLKLPFEPQMVGDMAADAFCMPRGLGGKSTRRERSPGHSPPTPQVLLSTLVACGREE